MGEEVMNKQIILNSHVDGPLKESDLSLRTSTIRLGIPDGCDGALFFKNLYLSVDPYLVLRMGKIDIPKFDSILPGSLRSVESIRIESSELRERRFGLGVTSWMGGIHLINDPLNLFKIQDKDVPLSFFVGIAGMPGMTAYVGFFEICSPRKGETVFVSAALGSVGQIVGQFAKTLGCYVVGSAGSKDKVDLLKNKFGFDDAFNYKEENDYDTALKRYFPEGIDVYFDNVGGKMLEAVINNMRVLGRIAICGMVSQYNAKQPDGIHNLINLTTRRIRMEGFVVVDYYHLYPKFLELVLPCIKEGKMTYVEDVSEGLESAPSALLGVYAGRNVGKQIVVVARE